MSHVRRFDHVGITVADLDAVTAFFAGLGLEVENRMFVEGEFLDTVIGIPGSRTEIVMLQPPDGGTRLELSSFARPDHLPGSSAAPPTSWDCATWPSRSMTCRQPLTGWPLTATGWSVASASTRALGGWPMSGVRRGSSSHWPSASAEPRKSGRGVPSCHEALRPDSVCQNRTFCARRIVPSARLLVTTESAIRREEPLCPRRGR